MKLIIKKILKKTPAFSLYKLFKNEVIKKYPEKFTKNKYQKFYGRSLDLVEPKYLSEKLQYLKLYEYPNNFKVIQAADKYTLHEYLKEKKLSYLSVPFIKVFEKNDDLQIAYLPQAFVIKKTNASGLNLIVKDKNKITEKFVNKLIKSWFKEDFGKNSIELHYSKAVDRVICEPFFENLGNEYRVFMVNGEIGFVQVITWDWTKTDSEKNIADTNIIEGHGKSYRFHYDSSWKLLWKDEDTPEIIVEQPRNFETMIRISKTIAKDFPIVRVDFSEINNELKIMELTFTPARGFLDVLKNIPELDRKLGKKLILEKSIEENN